MDGKIKKPNIWLSEYRKKIMKIGDIICNLTAGVWINTGLSLKGKTKRTKNTFR